MSKFDIDYREWGRYDLFYTGEFDPADYLECENEGMLESYVWEDITEAAREGGNAYLERDESEFELPEKFVEEWRHLKEMQVRL